MAVIASEIKLFGPEELPLDDIDPVGGAIDLANEITGLTVNELFVKRAANEHGGPDIADYTKGFLYNENDTDSLYNTRVFLKNGLILPAAAGLIQAVSTSADDNNTKYIRLIFERDDGTYTSEDVVMNGITPVSSTLQQGAGKHLKVLLLSVASDNLIQAAGNITITRGSVLGMIPAGYKTAGSHVSISMEDSLDDNREATNRLTAPIGSAFGVVNTRETAVIIANGGELEPESGMGIWFRRLLPDGMLASPEVEVVLTYFGEDA
jgi:hypothetical protein